MSEYYDGVTKYLDSLDNFPRVTPDEERALGMRCNNGDEQAISHMITANLKLVVTIAKQYQEQTKGMSDAIAAGNLGLVHAARRYDPSKHTGNKFSTFAAWWIKKYIRIHINNTVSPVIYPSEYRQKLVRINKLRQKYLEEFGSELSAKEIARLTGMHIPVIVSILESAKAPVRIADEWIEDGSIADFVNPEDPNTVYPGVELDKVQDYDALLKFIQTELTDRERNVIYRRFGLGKCEPTTLQIVGDSIGVTRERVRQIQKKAFMKIRNRFIKENLFDGAVREVKEHDFDLVEA